MITRISMSGVSAVLTTLLLVQPLLIAQRSAPALPGEAHGPFTFNTATGQRITVTQVAGGLVHPVQPGVPGRAAPFSWPSVRGACGSSGRRAVVEARVGGAAGTAWVPAVEQPSRCAALHRAASRVCPESTGLPVLPEVWASREHDGGGPGQAQWRHARGLSGDLRVGRLGELRREPGAHVVRARRHAVRDRRRPRPLLLRRVREHQPAHEGADPGQRLRQDSAHS